MIQHSIIHPKNVRSQSQISYSQQNYSQWREPLKMGKLEYAQWLARQPWKKGDFVVWENEKPPYRVQAVNRIVDIEEIHSMCQYERSENPKPMPFALKGYYGHKPWNSSLGWVKKVDHEDLPKEWQDVLAREQQAEGS